MNTDRLRTHLDTAYRVAQAITLDAQAAGELVERAYRNAYADAPDAWPDDEVRERLIRHVLAAHQAPAAPTSLSETTDSADAPGESARTSEFRALVIRDAIDRLLPTALATLPDHLRTLLVLIETENLSVPDASRVFGLDAGTVQHDRDLAHRLLHDGLLRSAGDVEREMLANQLRDEWVHAALVRHARTRFGPAPPTLALPEPAPLETKFAWPTARDAREPDRSHRPVSSRPRRILVAAVLILVAGLVGYVASALLESEKHTDIVTLAAARMDAVRADLESGSAPEIESYFFGETERRIRLPNIEQSVLIGGGMVEVAEGVLVPVALYRDRSSDERIPVFVYSYAILDRYADRLRLERDIMQQIQDERHFDLHDLGEKRVLIWRSRDEIFVAATRGDASDLQDRIQPAS